MWSYIAASIGKSTNYNVVNIDNQYKFHIVTMETLTDEQKKKFIDNMRIQLGMTYYNDFKMYLFRKLPESELLAYFH